MSRDALRQAHDDLAATRVRRDAAHEIVERAGVAVTLHQAEASTLAQADRDIADYRLAQLRRGEVFDALPVVLADAKRRADDAAITATAARTAKEQLLVERSDADAAVVTAQADLVRSASVVMAVEGEAIAQELLEAKARVRNLDGRLRTLAQLWIGNGPIQLPPVATEALTALTQADTFGRPIMSADPNAVMWLDYLKALQVDPDAVRAEPTDK